MQVLLIIFISIILLVVNLSPFPIIALAQPANFQHYINPYLQTSLYYPSDWSYFNMGNLTAFLSPNFATNSALIMVSNPIDMSLFGISAIDPQALLEILISNLSEKNGFTLVDASVVGYEPENSMYRVDYRYTDPSFGETSAVDIFIRNGDRVAGVSYLADPNTFPLYYQTFIEMVNAYTFTPTQYPTPIYPSPTDPPSTYLEEPNLEDPCITGDYSSITQCLNPGTTFDTDVFDALNDINNLQVDILQ
jgi:hypothetical protein